MEIQIKYFNGIRFKRFILNSAQRINQMEQYLNDINVFPVADGDTGTNMAATMNSIVKEIKKCKESSFARISNIIADSALTGARGNSGAILAQFFQGFAEATKGKARLGTEAFAQAATKAAEQARKAISHPQEGTIITVMKDWANHLTEHAPHTPDFAELFKKSLSKAEDSLAKTPEKLLILKKAGVVDAGAQGFVNILEGIVNFIECGKIRSLKAIVSSARKIKGFNQEQDNAEINFQFCTECLIEGVEIDREEISQKLSHLGDSLVVAGSENKVHIHIHTDRPEDVFTELSEFGNIVKTKVNDMQKQHTKVKFDTHAKSIGLVTDSTCDLPPELIKKYNIQIVPIVIQVGKKSYLDQVEVKPKEFIHILETSNEKLSTSQPPPAFFREAYNKIAPKYESIISLHISEKLSGTIQGARMGCKNMKHSNKIHIIDSKTSSVALGLLVAEAAQLIREGFDLDEIVEQLNLSIKNARIFIAVRTLKYIIRSGRLNKTKGLLGTLLNLKPILTINSDGNIVEAAKVIGQKKVIRKTLNLAVKFASTVKNPRFGIAHVAVPELAQWYCDEIHSRFANSPKVIISEASPALSVHIGIGGAAIAVLGGS
ncbi:DegV family EDD domain-containing protein [bacterium]|nr:DegV family EDD domain-containing protein [bacterium]MBU4361772.1 DegV family EDD domain-containing protein [bacterium]MBU4601521.1 DegV family EDD domain-containing protein [bacterium]